MVKARANRMRAAPGPASFTGIGIRTKIPTSRIKTSAKPSTVDAGTVSSPCILPKIGKDRDRVGSRLMQHVRQKHEHATQAGEQARYGAKDRILHRRHDLKQVNGNTDRECNDEQRRADPKSREQRLGKNMDGKLWTHPPLLYW